MATFSRYLSSDGTFSGDIDVKGNWAGGETEFWFEDPFDVILTRVVVTLVREQGAFTDYGKRGPLFNGLGLYVIRPNGSVSRDFLSGGKVKTHRFWSLLGGEICLGIVPPYIPGVPEDLIIQYTWNLNQPLLIPGNYRIVLTANDDLSNVDQHRFLVEGVYA
jgi:hypothetical protein